MASTTGGAGVGAFGSMPYGTGTPIALAVGQCVVRALNEIWVVVDELTGLRKGNEDSELNPNSWSLFSLSADAFPRLVQAVVAIETEEDAIRAGAPELFELGLVPALRVFTDGPLSPFETYELRFANSAIGSCVVDGIEAVRAAFEQPPADDDGSIDDFKNPQINRDKLPLGALGTFNITDDGDISIEGRGASLRKRMIRRITSAVTSFYHIPDYGTELENKAVITPDLARRIRDRVKNGIKQEPDVLASECKVYLVVGQEGMLVVSATAATVFGETVSVNKEVNVSG